MKTVVVTGSSSGIGRAIAIDFARQGWRVVLHGSRQSSRLQQVAEQIDELGGKSLTSVCDFQQVESLEPFVERCWEMAGQVDAWVNNAGGDVLTGAWPDRSLEQKLQFLFQVDVQATLTLSRLVGRRMMAQASDSTGRPRLLAAGSCALINIGWDQAWQGMAGESGELFATTKGAIMSMSLSLAQSLAPLVRVNCIAPGWIRTEWGESTNDYWDRRAQAESLMQRWGQPEDVAHLATFLASPQASFISGQVIAVNGGFNFGAGSTSSGAG